MFQSKEANKKAMLAKQIETAKALPVIPVVVGNKRKRMNSFDLSDLSSSKKMCINRMEV